MFRYLISLGIVLFSNPVLASSLSPLDLTLRIDSISWDFVVVEEYMEEPDYPGEWDWLTVAEYRNYEKGEGAYDAYLYHPLAHLSVGDEVSLKAMIDPTWIDYSWGSAPVCDIGGFDCRTTSGYYEFGSVTADDFVIGDDWAERWRIEGSVHAGGTVSYRWRKDYIGGFYADSAVEVIWDDAYVDFTVVRNNLITTPLPASLPMLAAGVLGMGWLARRRQTTRG